MARGWGGKRKGAGRPKELEDSEQEEVARYYHGMMQGGRVGASRKKWKRPKSADIMSFLAAEYLVSKRTVRRSIERFRPAIRAAEKKHLTAIYPKIKF